MYFIKRLQKKLPSSCKAINRVVVFGFLMLCSINLRGQTQTNFLHLDPTLNGKPFSPLDVLEDTLGYIWMTSAHGAYYYDGYEFTFIPKKDLFPSIQHNDQLKEMVLDSLDNIWFLSSSGLISRYNTLGKIEEITFHQKTKITTIHSSSNHMWFSSDHGSIFRYKNNIMDSVTTIPNINPNNASEIQSMAISRSNELYLGANNGHLFHYSMNNKEQNEILGPFSNYPGGLFITFDKKDRLWIGTENFGLHIYDEKNKKYVQNSIFKGNEYHIRNELFLSLYCDSQGLIWGGTDGGGLYQINPKLGKIHLFAHESNNRFSLSSNTILNINEDSHKNMWIISNYGKVNILPNPNSNIGYIEGTEDNTPTRVLSILKSTKKDLWIGTDGFGITRVKENFDGTTSKIQYFKNKGFKKGFYVQSMTEDENSNIWFGTYKNGLWHYNSRNDIFNKISIINSDKQRATDVRTVFKDSKQRIWVGSNTSLNVFSSSQKILASFKNNDHGLTGTIIESIAEDNNGTIWLGNNNGGLLKFNEKKNDIQGSNFTKYIDYHERNTNPYGIRSITPDGSGSLWLIDSNGQLLKYTIKTNTLTKISALENISAQSILLEDKKNIWISTSNGITHYNVTNSIVKKYYRADGLQDNSFLLRSAFKDTEGLFYFGGIKGLNYFNPKVIQKKESQGTLHISSIEILNRPARSLIPDQVSSVIASTEQLNLKYEQSSFSFKFSAIDNILNPNYFYSYRLKGFNDEWTPTKTNRLATYTNIPPGNYVFQVRAGTKKDVWNTPIQSITIDIERPWWNKPIAYIIYLSFFGLLIYGLKRWFLLRRKLFAETINNKKENELHTLKMNFFAKMSHEIQTPITLVLGPIDDMLKKAEDNGNLLLKQRLNIISINTKRLSKIARELTTVRNKELGTLRLMVTENNLFEDINSISLSFKEQARIKKIDFTINCPKNLSKVWYDKDKIEHAIYNLLSNAFKFTPKEGNIQLNVVPINAKNSIKISVSDSGMGIPSDELESIFTLFYQSSVGKKGKGSGIGLTLTKDLIDLHKGKMEVSSSPNEGTIFTIIIPIGKDAYLESEKITNDSNTVIDSIEKNDDANLRAYSRDKKTILIVEDNYELQGFLCDFLSANYNILLAENGEEGLSIAKNELPDLILSDIMMPKMDGVKMCKELQKNQVTKHIPIVLITAKNSTSSKISGLKSGAIEYISKPFNTNELLLKINNIISSKEHIISKYRKEIINRPEVTLEKSQDDLFLENLISAINSRIEDPNFKMEKLAEILNMSYSSLYRKCQAITGQSLIDFVRILRLKKGAIVIAKYGYNISEVAFMVGFNDPKYFSKCFKKQFGKTPKIFKKEANEVGMFLYLKKYNLESS